MRLKDENGNVVIEASIVMTIAVVMVAVLINLGMMMYNRNLIETVAQDVAVDVANAYSNSYRDPIFGYIDDSEFYHTELYRYLGDLVTSNHKEAAEAKAKWYSRYSLKKHQVSTIDIIGVEPDIQKKPGTIIQHQVVVKITAKFEAPLTAIWGGDNETTYVAVGRADCVDLLDYFNTVGTVKDTLVSKVDDLLGNLKKILDIFDLSSLEG